MSLLNTIVAFVVALGVLIVVHEFGHYLVARLCGVKVLRFSVGFGRPLVALAARPRPDRMGASPRFRSAATSRCSTSAKARWRRRSCSARSTARASGGASRSWSPGRSPTSCSRSLLYWVLFMHGVPGRAGARPSRRRHAAAAAAGLRAGDTRRARSTASRSPPGRTLRWRAAASARCSARALRVEVRPSAATSRVRRSTCRGYPRRRSRQRLPASLGLRAVPAAAARR